MWSIVSLLVHTAYLVASCACERICVRHALPLYLCRYAINDERTPDFNGGNLAEFSQP